LENFDYEEFNKGILEEAEQDSVSNNPIPQSDNT